MCNNCGASGTTNVCKNCGAAPQGVTAGLEIIKTEESTGGDDRVQPGPEPGGSVNACGYCMQMAIERCGRC